MTYRFAPEPNQLPFADDIQMQNWLWLLKGDGPHEVYAEVLAKHFNDAQRRVMDMTPADAMIWFQYALPDAVTEDFVARVQDAQARLFPPMIASRDGNVIRANFGRKKA